MRLLSITGPICRIERSGGEIPNADDIAPIPYGTAGQRHAPMAKRSAGGLVSDTRHAQFLPGILYRKIELQFAIFVGIRWQVISPDGYLAPLEAFPDVPDGLLACAPGG